MEKMYRIKLRVFDGEFKETITEFSVTHETKSFIVLDSEDDTVKIRKDKIGSFEKGNFMDLDNIFLRIIVVPCNTELENIKKQFIEMAKAHFNNIIQKANASIQALDK